MLLKKVILWPSYSERTQGHKIRESEASWRTQEHLWVTDRDRVGWMLGRSKLPE